MKTNNKNWNDRSILFIGPIHDRGGIGTVVNQYKKHFKESVHISTYPCDIKTNRIREFITGLIRIHFALKRDLKIKIIHVHCASKGSFYRKSIVLLLGKIHEKKIIMHMHGGNFKEFYNESSIIKLYIRHILKKSDKVICLSDEWETFYSNELGLKNTIVVENSVEIKKIVPQEKSRSVIRLIFLGKICREKGIFDLIDFLLSNNHFLNGNIHLTICGMGEDENMKDLIEKIKVEKSIEYKGWVEGEEKEKLIQQSDIFILPSYFEGVPMSILEAMSYSKPIISTNVGGIPSIVKEKHNGWLVRPGKLENLSMVFDEIFMNPFLLELYGINSLKMSVNNNPKKMFEKLDHLYEEIINN